MCVKMITAAEKTYCTRQFDRQLKALRRTDKKGFSAAQRAEQLISDIASGEINEQHLFAKQTKNGELRLNCRKYDLGSGYRLISLREDAGLCFVFIGTHDDCDRWLEKRRRESLLLEATQLRRVTARLPMEPESDLSAELLDAEEEYERYLASRLDEETLRSVFCGLRGGL